MRFYEASGLLPTPERAANGYREYGDEATGLLAFVAAAQAAGLTLAEIREVIGIREGGTASCMHVRGFVEAKTRAVTRQIAELRALRRELVALRERAAPIGPADCDPGSIGDVLAPARDARNTVTAR
ncbi:MAG: MerR family DNA-binding transcriptional regulator [Mycobacteriales bacterium]